MRMREQECPSCKKLLNSTSGAFEDITPKPRDITICLYCGLAMEWDEDMNAMPLSEMQLWELPTETFVQIKRVQVAIVAMKAARN